MAIEKQASCDDPVEPALLPVAVALQRMQAQVRAIITTEVVALRDALERVLAVDLVSPIMVPAYTNSCLLYTSDAADE